MAKKVAKTDFKTIEEKFDRTAFNLTQERNDFLLPQVLDFVQQKKWLNLRPEYQRRQVWDDAKRSLFIESLLLNVPIPPVFLYEYDLSRYEVMDGQQRLNSILDFYENRFALKKLDRWNEINGFRYSELPESLRRGLDRRRISATVLLMERAAQLQPSQNDVRKLVFERLNTGGQHLNPQELRNCLYAGRLNGLLISLSQNALFTDIWEIPPHAKNVDKLKNISAELRENSRYKRMDDCQIVLRFFAFREKANIRGSVRSMLDRYMEKKVDISQAEIDLMENDYLLRLKLAKDIFEERVFRYQDEDGKWLLSQPLYDGVMVAIDRLWNKKDRLLAQKSKVVKNVERLLKNEKAFEVIVGRPNTALAVRHRMDLLAKAMSR
jgi:hypothetical protein